MEKYQKRVREYVKAYETLRVMEPDLNKQMLKNLNAEEEAKKRKLAELSEKVAKLEPLLALAEDETIKELLERIRNAKSGKTFLIVKEDGD